MKSILFIFLIPASLFSQNYIKDYSKSVGLISFKDISDGTEHIGTGTLVAKVLNSDMTGKVFLVTCAHVLPKLKQNVSVDFRIQGPPNILNSFVQFNIPIFENNGAYNSNIEFATNGNDVCVIDITEQYISKKMFYLETALLKYKALATKDTIDRYGISEGDEVYFIGFPSFFFNKKDISPVVRVGTIATAPNKDYYFSEELKINSVKINTEPLPEKINGFLIDASVFGGSSGSLVFLKIQPTIINNYQFENNKHGRGYILGIATSSYFDIGSYVRMDTLNAGKPDSNILKSIYYQRINLGAVISSEVIRETIDAYVNRTKN
jgi:hypothetical protein